jgi:integrase
VQPEYWHEANQRVAMRHPNATNVNMALDLYENRAREYVFTCQLKNKSFSETELRAALFGKEYAADFFSFVEQELTDDTTLADGTRRSDKSKFAKFRRFVELKNNKSQLPMSDITYDLLVEYTRYMHSLSNNEGTINKDLAIIKGFMNRAVKKDLLDESEHKKLWGKITIRVPEGDREPMTLEELGRLEKLYEEVSLNPRLKKTLHHLLFECYTGLRYSDIRELRFGNLIDNQIKITQHKTKRAVSIPLIEQSKKLLPNKDGKSDADFVFDVYTNQVYNRYIKEVVKLAGIERNITSHIARHTLATIGMQCGIPMEVISKILGHTNIKTTMIYAKVLTQQKIDEMQKFSNKLKERNNL